MEPCSQSACLSIDQALIGASLSLCFPHCQLFPLPHPVFNPQQPQHVCDLISIFYLLRLVFGLFSVFPVLLFRKWTWASSDEMLTAVLLQGSKPCLVRPLPQKSCCAHRIHRDASLSWEVNSSYHIIRPDFLLQTVPTPSMVTSRKSLRFSLLVRQSGVRR